jgi:hypothetical protein
METLEQVLEQVGNAQSSYQFVMINPTAGIALDSPAIICHSMCLELYPEYSLFIGACDKLFKRLYRASNREKEKAEILTEAEIRFITKDREGKS